MMLSGIRIVMEHSGRWKLKLESSTEIDCVRCNPCVACFLSTDECKAHNIQLALNIYPNCALI